MALLKNAPTAFVTIGLVLANVLVYVAMVASGVSPFSPDVMDMLRWGADFGPRTLSGETWRLFTCMFVHFGRSIWA